MTRNITILLLIGTFLIACGGGNGDNGSGNDNGNVEQKIAAYETQIQELKGKISKLRKLQESTGKTSADLLAVNTEILEHKLFKHYITVSGNVEGVNQAVVTPENPGQIKRIMVKDGESVRKGQLLVELESSILENSLKEVETSLALAETIFQRRERLWNKKIGSEIEYLQAQNNRDTLLKKMNTIKSQIDKMRIRAPFNGVVDRVFQKKGEISSPGITLLQMVDPSSLYVNVDVSEAYVSVIKKGDLTQITFPSISGATFQAPVVAAGSIINKENRTFRVKVRIENSDGLIKPNVIAKVRLKDYEVAEAIIVPTQVVRNDITGSYVFVIKKGEVFTTAAKKYVKTGHSWQGATEILDGVKAGDTIITNGFNIVKNNQKVSVKN